MKVTLSVPKAPLLSLGGHCSWNSGFCFLGHFCYHSEEDMELFFSFVAFEGGNCQSWNCKHNGSMLSSTRVRAPCPFSLLHSV